MKIFQDLNGGLSLTSTKSWCKMHRDYRDVRGRSFSVPIPHVSKNSLMTSDMTSPNESFGMSSLVFNFNLKRQV